MSRALERGLRGAVAVMVLAIACAVIFPETAERFATTAYLGAIFAGVVLVLWRCIPRAERSRVRRGDESAPSVVAFWVVVLCALLASAAAAGSLAGEIAVAVAGVIVIIVAAVFPSGLFAPLHRELTKNGGVTTMIRYAVVLGIIAWAVTALVPASRGTASLVGFAMLVVACALTIASLRSLRDIIGATVLAVVAAFAVAACMPATAQIAAQVGYAGAVFVAGLLVLRARYA